MGEYNSLCLWLSCRGCVLCCASVDVRAELWMEGGGAACPASSPLSCPSLFSRVEVKRPKY